MKTTEHAIRYAELIARFMQQSLTTEEKTELDNWIAANPANSALFVEITNEETIKNELLILESVSAEKAWKRIEAALSVRKTPIVPIKSKQKKWMMAAAVLLLVASAGIYKLLHPSKQEQQYVQKKPVNDIQPGSDKAILSLADGSVIILDSAANGQLANQDAVKVIKLDGKLTYTGNADYSAEMTYNTISTPRGGQYQLELSDGSLVWMNAASSIRFPVAFTGKERKVEITGEAYFEVRKNLKQPFKVSITSKGEVEVLGTHFNINAYSDEATINTTLLEGSVKVLASSGAFVQLMPGQQAQLSSSISVLNNVNMDEIIAWKTGWFNFDRADISTIMRQVSRWYDVDVVLEQQPLKKTFSGIVSRGNNINDVLKIMEKAGVRFRIEGKKITVLH